MVISHELSRIAIVFVYSLHEALDDFKRELSKKKESDKITNAESSQLKFFLYRGSTLVAVTAISACLEVLLDKQIPDSFKLSYGDVSPTNARSNWREVLTPIIALILHLVPAVENGIKGQSSTSATISTFRSLVDATKVSNDAIYASFRKKVGLN